MKQKNGIHTFVHVQDNMCGNQQNLLPGRKMCYSC